MIFMTKMTFFLIKQLMTQVKVIKQLKHIFCLEFFS